MDRYSNLTMLNENNYATWKIQIKMYLMRDGLFSIVDGKEVAPTVTADAGATAQANLTKFEARRDKALANIVLHIDPKLLYIIGDPTDPSKVWTKLQDTFQKKTWANKLRLRKKLYKMELKPQDDLNAHLKEFIELFDAMAVIGDPVDDEDKVINLLASLPDSYDTIVTALESMDKVPAWENVTERLLHAESKLKSTSDNDESKALMMKRSKKNNSGCFECHDMGHMRKDCPVYKRRMKKYGQKKKPAKSYSNVHQSQEQSDSDEITLIAANLKDSALASGAIKTGSWILDSGSTHHMCYNRKLFKNIRNENDGRRITVGDGTSLNV